MNKKICKNFLIFQMRIYLDCLQIFLAFFSIYVFNVERYFSKKYYLFQYIKSDRSQFNIK